jgi:fumarate reductase subunit D
MSPHSASLSWRARTHPNYVAFVVHRVSGLALALFLPLHFWALGQALRGEAALDQFLRWTDHPLLRASEVILVALLAVHLAGGLRVLALELLPWRNWQKGAVALVACAGGAAALLFLLNLTGDT